MKATMALAVLALLAVAAALLKALVANKAGGGKAHARAPLTQREQAMYFRLVEAFPQEVVLAQVAFSALITSKHRTARNTFDRKVADFVLCSKGFSVIAVIELDDKSHKGREAQDAKRDKLLTAAGYRVLRFSQVPDADALRTALQPPAIAASVAK